MSDALRVALCVAAGAVVGAWLTMSMVEYWEWADAARAAAP